MVYTLIKSFNGTAKFLFRLKSPVEIESKFNLNYFSNGRLIITCEVPVFSKDYVNILNENKEKLTKVSMKGNVGIPGSKIEIKEMYIDSIKTKIGESKANCQINLISFSPAKIVFLKKKVKSFEIHLGLTNFVFGGCERTTVGTGFRLNKFRVNIKGYEIIFIHLDDYKNIIKELKAKKGILITSEAIVRISSSKYKNINPIIYDITVLLSYAGGTLVTPIYEDHYNNGQILKTILKPMLTLPYNHRNLLINSDHLSGCDLKIFLETVFNNYQKFKKELGLDIVINYYLRSKSLEYVEMEFLLGIVALESLSSHGADFLKKEGSPIIKSSIKMCKKKILKILKKSKISLENKIIDEIAEKVAFPHPFFSDKLIGLLKRFKIQFDQKDIDLIKIRNYIVHNGKFPDGIDGLKEYHRLIYLIDRTVLTILNYKNKPFLNIFNYFKEDKL